MAFTQISISNIQDNTVVEYENYTEFQNIISNQSGASFDKANSASSYANSAFAAANTADQKAVTSGVYANAAFAAANTGSADSYARQTANTADQRAVTSGAYANAAFGIANTADQRAVTSGAYANAAFAAANTADQKAVSAGSYANGAFGVANTATSNITLIQGVDVAQNNRINIIDGINIHQNTDITAAESKAQAAFNAANSKFSSSGGTISGSVTVTNDLTVNGNVSFVGNVTSVTVTGNTGQFFGYSANGFQALYSGIPTGYLIEPQIVQQSTANFDGYAGINIQNINSGQNSSADYYITADNGSSTEGYLDLGLAGSTYNYPEFNLIKPNDGYLIVSGNTATNRGNLIIGTVLSDDIIFAVHGINTENEVMRINSANTVVIKSNIPSTSNATGSLQVQGGIGVTGNVSASRIIFPDNTIQTTAASSSDYTAAAFATANGAFAAANTADQRAVTSGSYANSAFGGANSASSYANGAFATANGAFAAANSKFNSSGGTISGSVTVTGSITGNVSIATNSSSANSVGYLGVPQANLNPMSSNYTLVIDDVGEHLYMVPSSNSLNVLIPSNASVPFPIGTSIITVLDAAYTSNVVPTTGVTLKMAGNTSGANIARTIGYYSVASLLKVGSDTWYISGSGVT
jgi:hypothetical protein